MTIQELEHTIDLYGREVYSFCLRLTGSKDQADELYQDTFLVATEKLTSIESGGNPKSYLLSIAIRLWRNQRRKYTWRSRIAPTVGLLEELDEEFESGEDLQEDYISSEERRAVRLAVARLPDRFRMPVLLYYMEELTVVQIAEVLNIPAGTVKSRLSKARKLLEKELEGEIL